MTYSATPEGQASKARSCKFFAILAGILKNRPLRILRAVPEAGLEVWRQLHALFVPRTKVRSMAILNASNYEISKFFQGENVAGASADASEIG